MKSVTFFKPNGELETFTEGKEGISEIKTFENKVFITSSKGKLHFIGLPFSLAKA